MRFQFRPAAWFVLASYMLLSALPLAPLLFGGGLALPSQLLGASFVCWVTVWAIFRRPAWFHPLLLPAFLALPVEFYLQAYFGQGISTHHLGIIMETSPKEALEFLGWKVWLLGAVVAVALAWFFLVWRAAWATRE